MSFNLKQGDLRPPLSLQLLDSGGTAQADLGDADSIELRWTDPSGVVHTEDLALEDEVTATVEYEWQSGETALVGRYTGEVVVTWPGDVPQTFPPIGVFSWFVHPANGISWADVTAIASQLATVDAEAQLDILAYVNTALDTELFSVHQLKLLRVNLAAHMATVGPASGGSLAAGPLVREKLGPAEYQYADLSAAAVSSDLDSSPYGQMFTELLNRSAARIGFLI